MRSQRTNSLAILAILIIVVSGISIRTILFKPSTACSSSANLKATIFRSTLTERQFGGVRKYELPQGRFPNAIEVATDGSVWFGEQNLPGIGHLYPNATLVEYKWPFLYSAPSFSTFIWGIADWKGCVWATDQAASQVVGVDPSSGSIQTVKVEAGSFPYTLTLGPDNALWFTEVFASKIGRIDEQFNLQEYSLPLAGTPAQIVFANNTSGYYVDTGNVGLVEPGIFAFNLHNFSPTKIGSAGNLIAPTSLALVSNGVFVAEHATSIIAFYSFKAHAWASFPTSPVNYVNTTLPYFVATKGSVVWFNEHYANRMAKLDMEQLSLTEYSLSFPPATKRNGIDNALTFALGNGRIWFTALTADYVGYVDASYKPPFSISNSGSSIINLKPGGNNNLTLNVRGLSSAALSVQFADSEGLTGRPQKILMKTNATQIESLNGERVIVVNVTANKTLPAGEYELLVTATDGLISQGVYINLEVAS